MTDEKRLAEIEARCKAASPGPWEWSGRKQEDDGWIWHPQGSMLADTMVTLADTYEDDHKDLDFIAHARADIPWLLDQVRAAHAAGMQEAAEIANRMAEYQSSDSRAAMAQEIAAAILAQKDQAS